MDDDFKGESLNGMKDLPTPKERLVVVVLCRNNTLQGYRLVMSEDESIVSTVP